jgi:hypothetical protein
MPSLPEKSFFSGSARSQTTEAAIWVGQHKPSVLIGSDARFKVLLLPVRCRKYAVQVEDRKKENQPANNGKLNWIAEQNWHLASLRFHALQCKQSAKSANTQVHIASC